MTGQTGEIDDYNLMVDRHVREITELETENSSLTAKVAELNRLIYEMIKQSRKVRASLTEKERMIAAIEAGVKEIFREIRAERSSRVGVHPKICGCIVCWMEKRFLAIIHDSPPKASDEPKKVVYEKDHVGCPVCGKSVHKDNDCQKNGKAHCYDCFHGLCVSRNCGNDRVKGSLYCERHMKQSPAVKEVKT